MGDSKLSDDQGPAQKGAGLEKTYAGFPGLWAGDSGVGYGSIDLATTDFSMGYNGRRNGHDYLDYYTEALKMGATIAAWRLLFGKG